RRDYSGPLESPVAEIGRWPDNRPTCRREPLEPRPAQEKRPAHWHAGPGRRQPPNKSECRSMWRDTFVANSRKETDAQLVAKPCYSLTRDGGCLRTARSTSGRAGHFQHRPGGRVSAIARSVVLRFVFDFCSALKRTNALAGWSDSDRMNKLTGIREKRDIRCDRNIPRPSSERFPPPSDRPRIPSHRRLLRIYSWHLSKRKKAALPGCS